MSYGHTGIAGERAKGCPSRCEAGGGRSCSSDKAPLGLRPGSERGHQQERPSWAAPVLPASPPRLPVSILSLVPSLRRLTLTSGPLPSWTPDPPVPHSTQHPWRRVCPTCLCLALLRTHVRVGSPGQGRGLCPRCCLPAPRTGTGAVSRCCVHGAAPVTVVSVAPSSVSGSVPGRTDGPPLHNPLPSQAPALTAPPERQVGAGQRGTGEIGAVKARPARGQWSIGGLCLAGSHRSLMWPSQFYFVLN